MWKYLVTAIASYFTLEVTGVFLGHRQAKVMLGGALMIGVIAAFADSVTTLVAGAGYLAASLVGWGVYFSLSHFVDKQVEKQPTDYLKVEVKNGNFLNYLGKPKNFF